MGKTLWMSIDPSRISEAATRIGPHARRTSLTVSAPMSQRHGAVIAFKSEHQQLTGSFKLRGALNKVLGLSDEEAANGVITASSGNHGIGTATAAAIRGIPCTVYLPSGASSSKVAAIQRLGAEIVTVEGTDSTLAETEARAAAEAEGRAYVSPYNDVEIAAGQGTIAVEVLEDASKAGMERVDAITVAVGGGGLMSGIATWVKHLSPETVVIGASPSNDAAMVESVAAGSIIEIEALPTLSDGTAGGIEEGAITFDICSELVDKWVTVSEEDIASAMAQFIDDHHEVIEGAAGVALAAAVAHADENPGATVVAVLCGANISSRTLADALNIAAAT